MSQNEEKFTNKAQHYQNFRPGYPAELIDYLYTHTGLTPDQSIADIGSGTGIFSELLLKHGNSVFAIEPNRDMRITAEQHLGVYDTFHSVNASAEATTLPDSSMDFITVAQAFHWFNQTAFKKECQRILKKAGKVALIWNGRDFAHPIIQAEYALRQKYSDQQSQEDPSKLAKDWSAFFTEGICEYKTCRHDLFLNKEAFIGLTLSRSWAPNENETAQYKAFVAELTDIFECYQENGQILFPHLTQCYVGTVH